MRFTRNTFRIGVIFVLAAATACDRAGERLTAPSERAADLPPQFSITTTSVYVTNVEQLYAAVNDPANAGAAILLSPGNYLLSSTNGAGSARPNGGRLEFQRDMSLYGVTGDRGAVVIDASALPASAFNVSFGRTGPIRIGRGNNAVEWLTIVGSCARSRQRKLARR